MSQFEESGLLALLRTYSSLHFFCVSVRSSFQSKFHFKLTGNAAMALCLIRSPFVGLLLFAGFLGQTFAQASVNGGQTLYTTTAWWGGNQTCASSSCHFANAPPNVTQNGGSANHPLAANNTQILIDAFKIGGAMVGQAGNAAFEMTFSQAHNLSLYIGQYKAPLPSNSTLVVRKGQAKSIDVYALLPQDGTSGVARDTNGVTATGGVNGGSTSVNVTTGDATTRISYDITYTPPNASFVGADSFTYKIFNPAATSPAANTIAVTVAGIQSAATASGRAGQSFSYSITGTGLTAPYGISSGSLPGFLSLDANTGVISSSVPANVATGSYSFSVSATTAAGVVTQPVTVSVAGVTSSSTVNFPASVAIAPGGEYQITATADGVSNLASPLISYSLTGAVLQAGLSFSTSTGKVSGTPTEIATRNFTMSAEISSGVFVTRSLQVNVTAGPVPVTSTNIAAAPTVTTVGTLNSPLTTTVQIAGTNNATSFAATVTKINGVTLGVAQTLNAATSLTVSGLGLIAGTPTASGDFAVTVSASNANGPGTADVILRINSNLDPAFTSGGTATPVSVGTAGPVTVYSSAATNGPITLYDIVGSALPAGLTLNGTTGVVSASAPSTSGTFKATLRATNSGNRTGIQEVTFVINPTVAPVVSSPTFATLAAGVLMTPIQVVATNPPILEYQVQTGSSLPTGLSLDGITGIISGTPTSPGPVTVSIRARNAMGFGTALAVPFTVGVPAPSACTMTVPLNTATTLDLKPCMFPAFVPSGVSILATPSHGTAVVNGTTVTYTPANNYFGSDTFTAVASFAGGGTSTAGRVAVTITGRPDPTQDVAVTATLGAQTATVQQFALAQLANFQKRMDSLHSRGGNTGGAPTLQYKNASSTAPRSLGATLQSPSSGSIDLAKVASTNPLDPIPVPVAISTAQGVDAVATGLGLKALPFAEGVASLLTSRSVNLASLVGGNGLPDSQGSTSYWVEGVATFGRRDAVGAVSGYEFSSSGISVGADRRINDQWAVGVGLGYGRDKTVIGTDGSQNDGRGLTLATYASYQPSPGIFLDGLIGLGSIDFDTRRFVAPMNEFAIGNRKGTQIFGSLSAAYERRQGGVMVSPYGRLDFSSSKLLESTESGAGAYALTYFEQTIASLQGALGARAESIHSTSFGWAIPRVRAEFRHEFQGAGDAFISYADQIGGNRYAVPGSSSGRDSFAVGIGSDFIFRDGWTLGVDYQLTQSSAQESSYAIRFRVTKDFDAKGLPKLVGDWADTPSKPIDVQVDAGYVYDDNVTRAKAGPDQRSDSSYSVNVSKTEMFSLSEQSRFILTGSVGGERFQNFNGLSRFSLGVEGEIQYRESSEFDAPTFALFGRLTAEQFQSDLRDGYRYSLGVSIRQPLTDRISLFGALSHNERRANSAVFSTKDDSVRLNADYALSERETLYVSGEYRKGDIVSTGRASLENVSIARVFTQDDAFAGGQFFSYRFDGSTVLTTFGYNLGLGPRDSLDFSWRRVESTPSLRPSFVTSPKSYIDNQLSVTYLVRF